MEKKFLSLDEKPEKKAVSTMMVVFGILCLFTSVWWAIFLIRVPENDNVFWAGTVFLFLFGSYQIYAGLGFARRYIEIYGKSLKIRQNAFLPAHELSSPLIDNITIRSMDILFNLETGGRYKLKLGLRYPDLGENIKNSIIEYGELHGLEIFYKYDGLNNPDQEKN